MKSKALHHLTQIEEKRKALNEELSQYSSEELNRQPGPDQWSALQVMHHLYLAESYAGRYISKKLSFNPKLKKAGLQTWFKNKIMLFYLRSSMKWKAPTAVSSEHLPNHSELPEIVAKWDKQRKEIYEFLSTLPDDVYTKEVYKHPFAGRINLSGMLDFFEGHFDRHYKQIQRTLK
ncbi:MAG: hypothetical protein DHS20C18_14580 [Saprospiraceae bacterium]|nr:MAG: hypothetical protein DHS20C18_14580 [Saprospiraceae bacterium]